MSEEFLKVAPSSTDPILLIGSMPPVTIDSSHSTDSYFPFEWVSHIVGQKSIKVDIPIFPKTSASLYRDIKNGLKIKLT